MTIFLTCLHVIFCLTLILVILLQAGRGQGLTGASFGGGNVQSLFGTRGGDFMTKATTIAAICFLLTSIGLDVLEVRKSKSLLQFSQAESTIDVDTIKKALESVKDEEVASKATEMMESATAKAEETVAAVAEASDDVAS